jgi:ribosomal protein L11 methyltransferase
MCLAEVERHMRPGTSVLDVGTGSGILAIAAALLGASDVLALDTDAVAVRAARRNARVNGVGRTVRVRRGTLPLESARQFHLVLANISARVICDLAGHLVAALEPQGLLVASGFLEEYAEEVAARLRLSAAGVIDARVEEGWVTLVARRA